MLETATILLIMAICFGLIMAFAVGANDVANTMGTSIGSGAITMNQAIVIAAVFEALGALVASGQVTNTIGRDLLSFAQFQHNPDVLALGMVASLCSAGAWLIIASYFGWPVSTTHTIIGAVVGFASLCFGPSYVDWHVVSSVAMSWILTPALAGFLAFLLFKSVQKMVFEHEAPLDRAKTVIPAYIFIAGLVVCYVTLSLGLKPLGLHLKIHHVLWLSFLLSTVFAVMGGVILKYRYRDQVCQDLKEAYAHVEKCFGLLTVFTACSMAFAHGSNDTANAIGPVATVVNIARYGKHFIHVQVLPFWIVLMGAAGMAIGLSIYGYKVIQTVGKNITQLTPTRGFVAQLSTASVVVMSSGLGLPVSTTQVLVGALLGVGMARGIGAINLKVVKSIFLSWMVTLPAGALGSVLFFYAFGLLLGLPLSV